MNAYYQLEICANSVTSALAAQEGGAHRVEFCQNLEMGGTTPSPGKIRIARERLTIGMHVLIRPRAGDFLYTHTELEEMKADILFCKEANCDGIVIGLLDVDGRVDRKRLTELVTLAHPMHVTFHRAFDVCREPFEALEAIIACGCKRLLTSGMKDTAWEGTGLIKELVERADGRIEIMPGSGINETNLAAIAQVTGASDFHTSAKIILNSKMNHQNKAVNGMGNEVWESSKEKIRQLADILKNL
ncbi:copper homeostasis protein CutC [Parapedobacter indicus]|uniref:PF03932 family protein CutC n=1 Tax=Parapedobacter indicus TaxID=1477437 RepID=A0A1I3UWM8_9SPHI|nr:copper homeostasis protein CutC [Parapedobacter indicus]PPK99053.1 copper homeostasis protein [Parapedobacter indicus]SFJ87475.1 copper homeostasis protein [Parapedobacter indicus]